MNSQVFDGTRADSVDPIHQAVRSGDVDLLKKLITKGRSLRISDNLGYTPIHYAVRNFLKNHNNYLTMIYIYFNSNFQCLYGQEECLDELILHGNYCKTIYLEF